MREHPRRRVLQIVSGIAAGSIAGCSATDETAEPTTDTRVTARPGPTGTPTAESTDSSTPTPLATEAWRVDSLDGEVKSLWLPNAPRTPDSTGGPLYAGTTTGTVANLAVATGDIRWRFSVAGELTSGGHPLVWQDGETLVVVSDTRNQETLCNYVEMVDPTSGDRRWVFEEREFLTPLGIVDETLYLAGEYIRAPPTELGPNQDPAGEGRLHALDLTTGEERWRTVVPRLINASVTDHGLYANVAQNDNYTEFALVAYDRDGTERWRAEAGSHHLPKPVPIERGVLASTRNDSVALFTPGGTERWRVSGWRGGPSQIAATAERIYVGSEPLVAVSRSGIEQWRIDDYGGIVSPIRDGRHKPTLYVEQGQRVSAIDPEEGTVRWSFDPDNAKYVHAQTIVDDGLLIDTGIGRSDRFVLLGEADGNVVGDFTTQKPYWSAVAVASRVFVGSTNAVSAFDIGL